MHLYLLILIILALCSILLEKTKQEISHPPRLGASFTSKDVDTGTNTLPVKAALPPHLPQSFALQQVSLK